MFALCRFTPRINENYQFASPFLNDLRNYINNKENTWYRNSSVVISPERTGSTGRRDEYKFETGGIAWNLFRQNASCDENLAMRQKFSKALVYEVFKINTDDYNYARTFLQCLLPSIKSDFKIDKFDFYGRPLTAYRITQILNKIVEYRENQLTNINLSFPKIDLEEEDCRLFPYRFSVVNDSIFRSSAPSSEQIKKLHEKFGVKSILDLRENDNKGDGYEINGLDVKKIAYAMNANNVDENIIKKCLKIIHAAEKPILVHCAWGKDRTGIIIAAYRIVFEEMSVEDACNELREFGHKKNEYFKEEDLLENIYKEKQKILSDCVNGNNSLEDLIKN